MTRLVWATDIHLDFCSSVQMDAFLAAVRGQRPDGVLLGGDISEADHVVHWLKLMDDIWQVPIYFVLGNHDFYGSSVARVRQDVAALTQSHPRLKYLTTDGPVQLPDGWGLIGHDGWADGRIGDFAASVVMMHDYRRIAELTGLDKNQRWDQLKRLGDQAAASVAKQLDLAGQQNQRLLMLTHVPPFRDACWYEGQISDDQWAPHFTCQAVGESLRDYSMTHRDHEITVLCGHTHGAGLAHPARQITVYTGGAEYGHPRINYVLEIDSTGIQFG